MDVSILIVSYNSAKFISACFESIERHMKGLSYEIIVVDNSSADETVPLIRDHWPDARIVENKINTGFAAANNQAALIAKGEFLFLLNADTTLLDSGIQDAVRYARINGTAVIGPKTFGIGKVLLKTWKDNNNLYYHMLDLFIGSIYFKHLIRYNQDCDIYTEREVKFLTGSAMLISRKIYEQFGPFDEQFFFTGEERDLCMRFTKAGLKLVYYPTWSICHHIGHGDPISPFHYINWVKSSLKLARKHGGLIGYVSMIFTLGLYTLSSATTSTIKQLLDPSDSYKSRFAKTRRSLFFWYLGFLPEKYALTSQ